MSKLRTQFKRVHFVGIGGMGISAAARLFVQAGAVVSGSDRNATRATRALTKLGVPIKIGEYRASSLPRNADLIVFTKDEEYSNPELALGRKLGISVKSYPESLPIILQDKAIIGVAGTHGKTTTTGMLGSVLVEAQRDPTIVVGSWFNFLQGNARYGEGRFAVLEADEYKRAFLHHTPTVAVVTNVEADHLNYYKNLEDVYDAFRSYVARIPRHGALIACADDKGAQRVASTHQGCTLLYGLGPGADIRARIQSLKGPQTRFTATYRGERLGSFLLRVPGEHNVKNALAALAAASYAGVPISAARRALAEFAGAWRRFEFKGERRGVTLIDDYAHHPTEVRATLKAARERFGKQRIIVVFQPHFYGRLKDFFKEFVSALCLADRVVVPPVYFVEGREDDPKVAERYNSLTLAAALNKKGTSAVATPSMSAAVPATVVGAKKGDVVMTIGAGTVTQLGPQILKALA
ncbi:MAG: UDP-N-acetylmuramate--L-alanine ligase [bacterium]|nr:UDP-N-acetylmuramate--L-alanine ligase [bacterium]